MKQKSAAQGPRPGGPARVPLIVCFRDREITVLAENPGPPGCKKLRGYKDHWRIRVGEWGVLYAVDDAAKRVSITGVAHRREVYES